MPVGGDSTLPVHARIIAACNRDLETLCDREEFRRDLFYRLNVINIHVPPLRERRDDIPLLVASLVRRHSPKGHSLATFDETALDCLNSYAWPGNVRELENVIERALTLNRTGRITRDDFPSRICTNLQGRTKSAQKIDDLAELFVDMPSLSEVERRYLLHVLEATGGNRSRAAEVIGISRRTIYRMAERFGIEF